MNSKNKGGRPTGPNPKKLERILEILKIYKEGIWLRNLSSESETPISTVSYYIDKFLDPFIDNIGVKNENRFIGVRMVKLKPGKESITVVEIMNYWKIRRSIKNQI
jgi:hypothetical protein